MSNKTTNSDMSSSNEDGTMYKYDDLRSLTSFNSSEVSRDTKNPDSGIGTSISSSYLNHRDKKNRIVVKKIELLDELKTLLKIPQKNTNQNQEQNSNNNKDITINNSSSLSSQIESDKQVAKSVPNLNPKISDSSKNNSQETNNEYDVDLLVYKAIQYIKKLKKNQNKKDSNGKQELDGTHQACESTSPSKELVANISYKNEEMCISILVKTGLIVYVDERLTNLLGQTAKAWIGRRPIDYLFKDDINLLLTKLCELTTKINTGCRNISEIDIDPFYLRFKKENKTTESEMNVKACGSDSQSINSPSSNSNDFMPTLIYTSDSNEYIALRVELKADKVELKPFDLDEKSKTMQNPHKQLQNNNDQVNLETCILFKLSYPTIAYYKDIDNYTERSFISEHDVNLQITRVENKVTELLGYLPQELEKKSFIKFIHPDDLAKIKQIHYDIFDGKERQNQEMYRWKCHNGCYVSVRTNWSWFIHPWKKQIDFIIGKHVVLVDPMNKNIFEDNKKYEVVNKSFANLKIHPIQSNLNQQQNQKSNSSSSNANLVSSKSTGTNSDESNNDKRTFNLSSSRDDAESDFSNKIEKDIIEYISRKIPGMDDATQMLGQDVIKFIKKKNISASYCQEQSRIMKKNRKETVNYKPIKKFNYAYEYPQYFQSRPRLERSAVKRLNNFQNGKQFRSSSSSNSGYARAKERFALRRTKRPNQPMTSKQAEEAEMTMDAETSDESKKNQLSSNESNLENKIQIKSPSTESLQSPVQKPKQENHLPPLFEDIMSKKMLQPSLIKDHSFFTQYTICKYIDDLPNSWTIEDGTGAATGEMTVGLESVSDMKQESQRGVKRALDEEEPIVTSQIDQITKSRKLSSNNNEINITNIYSKNQTETFLGDKTMFDYLLNNEQHSNLVNVNSGEDQNIFKKANSYSSKSHSRIVLIDENDNDEEEETAKMIVSQTSEDNPIEYSRQIDHSVNIPSASHKVETKVVNEKHARLTKENLAKHTREQDEFYLVEILKKVQRNYPKKISDNPQNICAQNPNVFSSNEYEPKMKQFKNMHQILREKNPNSPLSSTELAVQYENELNNGPYSRTVNEIDFDNPQNYHESFNKKLQADLALTKDIRPLEKLFEKPRLDKKLADDSKLDTSTHKAQKLSTKDKESTVNSSNSNPSFGSNKNDDVLSFWKKCIRQGSAIVKRIKEADGLIKLIGSSRQKKNEIEKNLQNQENVETDPNLVNINRIHGDPIENLNDEIVILKYTKQLKKKLYMISTLLGINTDIGFDDISIDSDKTEILDSYIKKLINELLNTKDSIHLTAYTTKVSSLSPKHMDTNSIELLTCVFDDLKHKFLSQFDRFNKDNKLIFNSSSSGAFQSSTSNNSESSSQIQRQANVINMSRSTKSKSPNDFEFSSHNTNEFDDSSTYLYDSPTSSLESTDMLSVNNSKSCQKIKQANKSIMSNDLTKLAGRPRSSNQDDTGFDDGLLCKIMQNYVDLFRNRDETCESAPVEEPKFSKSTKTSSNESTKMPLESYSRSNDSNESKSNRRPDNIEAKIEEEECIKHLNLNIYNDCFKCLSKVSALDNQRNETESD